MFTKVFSLKGDKSSLYSKGLRIKSCLCESLLIWLSIVQIFCFQSPLAADPDYESIYREFREIVMDADSQKVMGKLDR